MNRFLGVPSVLLICLVTFNLWMLSKGDVAAVTANPLLSLSQLISLLAVVLMSLSLLLTTRFRLLEDIFGGQDKVYQIHRILGAVAFVFIINHPLLLAANVAGTPTIALRYLVPGDNLALNTGIYSLYFFLLAFIFMVFIKIPYHLWKWAHRILGVGFLLGIVHILIIDSDVSRSLLLRGWILLFISLGISSLIYTIFLYRRLGPKYRYVVDGLERRFNFINIWLKPVDKVMNFDPGQFTYVKFHNQSIGGELHPFSLSSAGFEEKVRLSVKIVGDYTLKLPNLKLGDRAEIFGPYGAFGRSYRSGNEDLCFIGGGIGITPFLSILRQEYIKKSGRKIIIFYSYKSPEEGVFAAEINNLVKELENVTFVDWCSQEMGRLDAKKIAGLLDNLAGTRISICGPQVMMEQLKKQFIGLGVPDENIIYEKFQMV